MKEPQTDIQPPRLNRSWLEYLLNMCRFDKHWWRNRCVHYRGSSPRRPPRERRPDRSKQWLAIDSNVQTPFVTWRKEESNDLGERKWITGVCFIVTSSRTLCVPSDNHGQSNAMWVIKSDFLLEAPCERTFFFSEHNHVSFYFSRFHLPLSSSLSRIHTKNGYKKKSTDWCIISMMLHAYTKKLSDSPNISSMTQYTSVRQKRHIHTQERRYNRHADRGNNSMAD